MKHTKAKVYHSKSYLKQKLMSATAMLLIASILMVSASYAWFVMSTAPEVSNIKTQVGANGALEIALLDKNSWDDLTLLDSGDIDESVTSSTTSANLTWGNLVDLSDSSYGLSQITLQPARLYIEQSGTSTEGTVNYAVNKSSLLKVPQYGEDGRIQSLTTTGVSALTYNSESKSFSTDAHGVRAIGTSADMNQFQLGMNTARQQLSTYMSSARTAASKALSDNGNALAGIASAYALESKTTGYTNSDIQTVKSLAEGLSVALDDLELALRQAFAGYITTAASGIEADDYADALAEINDSEKSLDELYTAYSGISNVIPEIKTTYIDKLAADQTAVNKAITDCNDKLDNGSGSYTWSELVAILSPLVDPNNMTLGGMTLTEIKGKVTVNGSIDTSAAAGLASQLLTSEGVVIGVPSGTGVLANIADFAGDYTASVTIESLVVSGHEFGPQKAKISTQTSANPVYLTVCSNKLRSADTTAADGSNAMTDFYGYALDLAFRTNALSSNLLLQTESKQRIYDGNDNANTQGGGSYMKFGTTSTTMSATKMIKLMDAIRVVLMDSDQNILGIATLDTTLVKSNYTIIKSGTTDAGTDANTDANTDADTAADDSTDVDTIISTSTGTDDAYAYLDIGGNYQPSDVISKEEYDNLPDGDSVVTIDKENRTISAKLYLHDFSMTLSTASHTEDQITKNNGSETFYTGGITIGEKKSSQAITALTQDTATIVTAMVYLDGSTVTNATVSADTISSMTGTLNLQFSSDADLIPAENTALRNIGSGSVTYTQAAAAGAEYQFGDTTYTVNEGYTIYTGSDEKIYYKAADSEDYVELTLNNVTTVLTVKSTEGDSGGTEQNSGGSGTEPASGTETPQTDQS